MLFVKDYGCVVTISSKEQYEHGHFNHNHNKSRYKFFQGREFLTINVGLFTEIKITEYMEIIHCLHWILEGTRKNIL
jgi:hypothetical protein